MRVLYVEDNEVNQALVARVMRARQCQVIFREEGEGALQALADDPEIDLILMDIELAGLISGLDVVRMLRARNDQRPIVAVTAYAMMGDRERILEAGCDQYLPKPLVISDLLNLIDEYEQQMGQKDAGAAPAAPMAADTPAAPASTESPAAPPADTPAAPASPTAAPAAEKPAPEPPAAVPSTAPTASAPAAPAKPVAPAPPAPPAESPAAPASPAAESTATPAPAPADTASASSTAPAAPSEPSPATSAAATSEQPGEGVFHE